jgi:hypothetical protein
MAEPKYRSADVPRYDAYPAPAPEGSADREQSAGSRYQPGFDEPEGADLEMRRKSDSLVRGAEQIGQKLGRAVVAVRQSSEEARTRLRLVKSELDERLQRTSRAASEATRDLRADLRGRAAELADTAQRTASGWKEDAARQLCDLRDTAAARTAQMRFESRRIVSEYPLHVLAGVAAAAFLAGISIRIVRSRNA